MAVWEGKETYRGEEVGGEGVLFVGGAVQGVCNMRNDSW